MRARREVDVSSVRFKLNGAAVEVPSDGTLLTTLRERLGISSTKDGCAPQGQCGCCTVWVDGQPRVACVTPVARVEGREVTTLEGLDSADEWARAFCDTGASQCGFCTPGIIMRLAADEHPVATLDEDVAKSLLAHLCRCTGWQTIGEAVRRRSRPSLTRDVEAAVRRATLEGGTVQRVGPEIARGEGGFADDTAPDGARVFVLAPNGEWVTGADPAAARRGAGVVPGRKSTVGLRWPIEVPEPSEWSRTLVTTWVEPAPLEPDAVWCRPGEEPVGPLGNGGAFGGKTGSWLASEARRLADREGRPVRLLLSREDSVRRGVKRPPIAAAVNSDGSGVVWVRRTPGVVESVARWAPDWRVHEVDVPGPPTSLAVRGALWAEIAVLRASVTQPDADGDHVRAPDGGEAWARLDDDGSVRVRVRAGRVLDEVVMRSYVIGAAHMALGWVRSEGIAVDESGEVHDLTIRSFGVLRAVDMPKVDVEIVDGDDEPVNGSDAVFAAVAAAAWRAEGFGSRWPTRR